MMTSFRYLGRVISATDNDWPEVVSNLFRSRAVCRRMVIILGRERALPRVSGLFFKSTVQVFLIFGSETWVVTPRMGKALGGGSGPDGDTSDGTAPLEDTGREVDIHFSSNGTVGGRFLDYGRIHHTVPEHYRTLYRYAITVRPV